MGRVEEVVCFFHVTMGPPPPMFRDLIGFPCSVGLIGSSLMPVVGRCALEMSLDVMGTSRWSALSGHGSCGFHHFSYSSHGTYGVSHVTRKFFRWYAHLSFSSTTASGMLRSRSCRRLFSSRVCRSSSESSGDGGKWAFWGPVGQVLHMSLAGNPSIGDII